jgi:hypothetical protein
LRNFQNQNFLEIQKSVLKRIGPQTKPKTKKTGTEGSFQNQELNNIFTMQKYDLQNIL